MSLTINTGITARTPNPSLYKNLPAACKDGDVPTDHPSLKVNLTDKLAKNSQEAAASTYRISNLTALKQNFYKSSID